ncbi:biotin--protein ligase-like [Amphibalanus amphitrite]|uniref:biotin--protein ligase-like n=1 Tax=Amphibalanus amphitrite TaxID=1232801 RepID=UPI001C90F12B|nr:biotin--protein ligase-like [Amphibalanus amphitrite]XP_043206720.1 biotin--protein ligase-like [Amphibalanus amphitrite]XP_043206721.1 biotin--protein ligase-like [Amphibalanus amphitrite]
MYAVSRTNIIRQLRSLENLLMPSLSLTSREMASAESQAATESTVTKPPNVVIHHGAGGDGQARLRQLVTSVVSSEYYTFHDLPVAAPPVWLESAALLVVAGQLSAAVSADAERFWRGGGAVLSVSSSLTLGCLSGEPRPPAEPSVVLSYAQERDVTCRYSVTARPLSARIAAEGACEVTTPVSVRREDDGPEMPPPVLRCCPTGGGGAVLLTQLDWDVTAPAQLRLLRALLGSELGVRCAEPEQTEVQYELGYLMADAAVAARLTEPRRSRCGPELCVVSAAETGAASAERLPLLVGAPPTSRFNHRLFESELETAVLGRCLVFLPAVTSTMDVLRDARLPHGAAVVCDRQTRGRGRAGNTWLSPAGCCMLSVRLLVTLDSPLGGRLSWLQHAAALAVAEAVGDPRLGLKWPNDLYWEGRTKVGGVLVETDVMGRSAECRLGLGVNLDNAAPTVCLNRLLAAPLARERLLARLLSRLEELLTLDTAALAERYRSRWLHERQPVTVQRDGESVPAEVCGLDQHGFLLVRAAADGAELAVSPDGNSFDMMRGLIVPKQAG